MRILLSTFAISPCRGSEAGIGWNFAIRLAELHDVTVLYGDLSGRNDAGPELERWFRDHPESPRFDFVYVPPGRAATIFERLHAKPGLRPLYYTAYRLWQKRALSAARRLQGEKAFDLAHQLTYTGFWEPGYLWRLGIPFFWGPVAGGNVIPLRYLSVMGLKGAAEALARFVLNRLTLVTRPRVHEAARHAGHIWCVTEEEVRNLARFNDKISLMLDVGANPIEPHVRRVARGEPIKLVWSGLHIPRKALPILVRAVAKLSSPERIEVHVLGAGQGSNRQTEEAKLLSAKLGVASRFRWHGNLPREEALHIMRNSHVLVHTSLLEGVSFVVMESISSGMPVICHDACGMAKAVTGDCGIKIPMTGVRDSILGFAKAIQSLIENPQRVEQLSQGAANRSSQLQWRQMVDEFDQVYGAAASPERHPVTSRQKPPQPQRHG